MQQANQQAQAAKPAPRPLPQVPPEFEAAEIMKLDAAKLVAILKDPAATVFQKAKASTRLAVVGGKEAVPALAALLTHKELSGYARFGLEPNPDPSADVALRAALSKVEGKLLAGVATSIGVRGDVKAIDALAKLVANADEDVAGAAAAALGRIGTVAAAKALEQAQPRASMAVVVARALLLCADRIAATNRAAARPLYEKLSAAGQPKPVRLAAIRALA